MNILFIEILFLLLSIYLLFPVRTGALYILPLALLVSLTIFINPHTPTQNSVNILGSFNNLTVLNVFLTFILIRFSSAWIFQIVNSPLNKFSSISTSLKMPVSFLIIIQITIFMLFIESDNFWEIFLITENDHISGFSLIQKYSYHFFILILPVAITSLFLQVIIFFSSGFLDKNINSGFLPLFYSLSMLFAFYFSLPLLKSYIALLV